MGLVRLRRILNYESPNGDVPFQTWATGLNVVTRARILKRINKLKQGLFGNCESVGGGVTELKENFGPGYRIYIGQDGEELVILLGGGSKKGQQADIDVAKARWQEYLSQPDDDEEPAPEPESKPKPKAKAKPKKAK